MKYEWNKQKRLLNLLKHKGIDFVDAVAVFEDEQAITIEDEDHDEQRFVTVGKDAKNRILVVVYTHTEDSIRIISARKANKNERYAYQDGR